MIWQGDFGKGVPTGSGVWSDPGVNPCLVYGPVPAAGISDNGVPFPSQRLGMVVTGDAGAEFIMGKLVLAAATDLLPGQAYELDEDYNMTLLTGGNSVLNAEVVLAQVWYPQCPAGTYYVWGQRAGRAAAIMAAASVATGYAETTATAGMLKYPATPTAGQKSVAPASAITASAGFTFTAATVNGSPTLTNVSSIKDLALGALLAGTGIPANANIAAIRKTGNSWAIDIGTNTAGAYATLQNATANGTGVTVTVSGTLPVQLDWPTLNKQN
jgi:hypothetical protein